MTKLDKWFLTKLKADKKIGTDDLRFFKTSVEYTEEGLKPWVGGVCSYKLFGSEIKIKPKYKDKDNGILAHELTHARQYAKMKWLHLLLKKIDKYTLFIELDAYREQIKCYDYTTKGEYMWIINSLTNPKKYGLKISIKDALEYADFMFEDIIEANKLSKN
jgi:hypothetical protein